MTEAVETGSEAATATAAAAMDQAAVLVQDMALGGAMAREAVATAWVGTMARAAVATAAETGAEHRSLCTPRR